MNGNLELTKELLSKGYSFDRPEELPDHIKVGWGFDKGEFVFDHQYIEQQTFVTPCGLKVKGVNTWDNLSYCGKEYRYENHCGCITCHFANKCNQQSPEFKKTGAITSFCEVKISSEPWSYEQSYEKKEDRYNALKEKQKHDFLASHPRSCKEQIDYDGEQWKNRYNFDICRNLCKGGGNYCPVAGKELSRKKANVFFDIRVTRTNPEFKGSLFEGDELVSITKGNRFFDSPISEDLCERLVKSFPFMIQRKEESRRHADKFFAELKGEVYKVDIENIRVEKKESRDLLQDLQDIADGIQVVHALDSEKQAKARKKEEREERARKKENRIERKKNEAKQINLFEDLGG
jgi:hypothetical protein